MALHRITHRQKNTKQGSTNYGLQALSIPRLYFIRPSKDALVLGINSLFLITS